MQHFHCNLLKIYNICKINYKNVSDLQYNKTQNAINFVSRKLLLSIRKYLALIFITTVFYVNKFKIKVKVISLQRLNI